MLVGFDVVQSKREHIDEIAPLVREADRTEFLRASGLPVKANLHIHFDEGEKNWTGFHGDKIVLMAGVADHPLEENVGIPWMVATDELPRVARQFLKHCRPVVDEMKLGYTKLVNYVDAENKDAVDWLKWLGFTILESEPYGVSRAPFHKFEMEIKECVTQ